MRGQGRCGDLLQRKVRPVGASSTYNGNLLYLLPNRQASPKLNIWTRKTEDPILFLDMIERLSRYTNLLIPSRILFPVQIRQLITEPRRSEFHEVYDMVA